MSFSTGLKIIDFDDFITPTQECIKPVKLDNSVKKTSKIIIGDDGSYTGVTESGDKYKMEKVNITLSDCLACSGCVTSAETVLINEHSNEEFLKKINLMKTNNNNDTLIVLSISPQSKSSLSVKYNLGNIYQTDRKLKQFFKTLSIDVVLDTTFGREFSLVETANELKDRMKLPTKNNPLMSSACPGWVCYAEKHKVNGILVPLISKAKSPQQVMGYLVKHYLPNYHNKYQATQILHVTVMPCFDKKLEATRTEFSFKRNNGSIEKDVDIVLSTLEIEQIIAELGYDFNRCDDILLENNHEVEEMFSCVNSENENVIYSHEGSGSGGYLDFAMRFCAKELFNIELQSNLMEDPRIKFQTIRNVDFKEISLISEDTENSEPLLTFAIAYGFRNIQSIVQKIRLKKCNYQFIEIMACPSGCLNGGGQIRSEPNVKQNVLLQQVTDFYQSTSKQQPLVNKKVQRIYDEICHTDSLLTTYNIIPKIEFINPALLKW